VSRLGAFAPGVATGAAPAVSAWSAESAKAIAYADEMGASGGKSRLVELPIYIMPSRPGEEAG
jgi:hypothetical protein